MQEQQTDAPERISVEPCPERLEAQQAAPLQSPQKPPPSNPKRKSMTHRKKYMSGNLACSTDPAAVLRVLQPRPASPALAAGRSRIARATTSKAQTGSQDL